MVLASRRFLFYIPGTHAIRTRSRSLWWLSRLIRYALVPVGFVRTILPPFEHNSSRSLDTFALSVGHHPEESLSTLRVQSVGRSPVGLLPSRGGSLLASTFSVASD